MQSLSTETQQGGWVLLAVALDAETAEQWADALEAGGIDAEVRIDDAVNLTGGSSPWPTASPGGHRLFAFPLYVPAARREAAAALLVDQGWDGRFGQTTGGVSPSFVLRGAVLATLAGAAVALLLIWRGS